MTTVRTFVSVAVAHQWPSHQMDMKKDFLNRLLIKEKYMTPPSGLSHPPLYVDCDELCMDSNRFLTQGLNPSTMLSSAPSILKTSMTLHFSTALLFTIEFSLYMLMIWSLQGMIPLASVLKDFLSSQFDIKDLGPLWYFLTSKLHIFHMVISQFWDQYRDHWSQNCHRPLSKYLYIWRHSSTYSTRYLQIVDISLSSC